MKNRPQFTKYGNHIKKYILPQTCMVLMTKYNHLYKALAKCRSRLEERIDSAVIRQICAFVF